MFDSSYLLALVAALFFGLALVLTQFGLRGLPPLRGAAISIPTTAVIFLLLAPFTVDWSDWNLRGALVFAAIGCLFPVAVTVLTFASNHRIGPNFTATVGNLAPLFAVSFATVLLGEAPRFFQGVGIGVIVLGVSVMTFSRGGGGGASWPLIALAMPLAAALIRGLVQPAIKFGLDHWDSPFAAVTIGYAVSAVLVLTVAKFRSRPPSRRGDRRATAWFACVGICNGVAVLTLYLALARGSVAVVAPLAATYPIATLALSGILLRDMQLTWTIAFGIAITVMGAVLLLAN